LAGAALAACLACLSGQANAYESDQFTKRPEPVADSTAVLNRRVNETIAQIVLEWRGGRDDLAFVDAVYHRIGGHHWVDKLERWAMKSPEVARLDVARYDSIFSGHPIWAVRVVAVFGVGKTIRVNDQLIGTDKIGHFLSQGRKYYRRYLKYESEARAAKHSAYTERAIFGQLTTGIYSNADLVANYEGHRFYRSLFEGNVIPGKPAILAWQDGGWTVQREFDWADHVNAYWDEALNVNHYDALLYKHMHARLVSFCDAYWEQPELYAIENEEPLRERYAHLQLRDTSELRLDSLCPVQVFLENRERGQVRAGISSPGTRASP
jgi:hypothetical protein